MNITDDVALNNVDRYLGSWHNADAVYYVDPKYPADSLVARLNMKKYAHSVFFEDNRRWVLLETIDGRTIKIKDFLWESLRIRLGDPVRIVKDSQRKSRTIPLANPEGFALQVPKDLPWRSLVFP